MVDSRPIIEKSNEILFIPNQFTQHNMKMDDLKLVLSIIDKFLPSWKDYKRNLKHKKEELSLKDLSQYLCIEEEVRLRVGQKERV